MATAAVHYGMPKFLPDAGIDELRNWSRVATPEAIIAEHEAMLLCIREFPRYIKMAGWLETIAELRGVWLV
jgi:hypothetical protein